MTKTELQGLFYEIIGQTSSYARAPGTGTPVGPDLLDLLDESILEMAGRAKPCTLRKMKTYTLAYSTADEILGKYDLPTDFLDYWHVEEPIRIAGRALEQRLEGEIDSLASDEYSNYDNSLCSYWYEAGVKVAGNSGSYTGTRQIGFFPIPRSGTAKLPYLRTPTLLSTIGSSTEYFDLPGRYHRAVVMRAAAMFFQLKKEKPGDNQDIGAWLAYFDSMVTELQRETSEQLRATFRRVAYDVTSRAVEDWMPV